MKKLRVLVLMHEDLVPPKSIEGLSAKQIQDFRTEWAPAAHAHWLSIARLD